MSDTVRLVARVLLVLSVLALFTSAAAHLAALLGFDLPSAVMGLHAGVLVLGLPAMFVARSPRSPKIYPLQGRPRWLKAIVMGLAGYAALNFPLTLFLGSGLDRVAAEGDSPAFLVRLFSGLWMLFYAADVAAYYPALRPPADAPRA